MVMYLNEARAIPMEQGLAEILEYLNDHLVILLLRELAPLSRLDS